MVILTWLIFIVLRESGVYVSVIRFDQSLNCFHHVMNVFHHVMIIKWWMFFITWWIFFIMWWMFFITWWISFIMWWNHLGTDETIWFHPTIFLIDWDLEGAVMVLPKQFFFRIPSRVWGFSDYCFLIESWGAAMN